MAKTRTHTEFDFDKGVAAAQKINLALIAAHGEAIAPSDCALGFAILLTGMVRALGMEDKVGDLLLAFAQEHTTPVTDEHLAAGVAMAGRVMTAPKGPQ